MRINPVNFKGVYRTTDKQFSPAQYKISEYIKTVMTSSGDEDNHGCTPADKLKKRGYDIILSPIDDDKVQVSAVKDLKKGVGIQPHTYSESIYVGIYNRNTLFSSNDIKSAISTRNAWSYLFMIPLVAFIALLGSKSINKCSNIAKSNGNVEYHAASDSLKDSTKTLYIDSLKLFKK